MLIERKIKGRIEKSLTVNPVTAILGARQTGKTTLIKQISADYPNVKYLDLERPSDRNLLTDAESFFKINNNTLICLDEIQLFPELFPVIRALIDDVTLNLKFLITGSASPELLRQSSESLAGRIAYFELTPFLIKEIEKITAADINWFRGGFPLSILASDDENSVNWREQFIRTFLERDIRNFGFNIPPETIGRLWKMLAHIHGQLLNYSQLANSMGTSETTVRKYIDILSYTYMVRLLKPYHFNIRKRLIKSPKVYLRDTGILHSLLAIEDFNHLYAHPVWGSSWESFCIENITNTFSKWEPYFYRTSNGNEIDLLLVKSDKKVAIEITSSTTPKLSTGFWNASDDLKADKAFIIARINKPFHYKNGVWAYPLQEFLELDL
jgi:predicted AAA+ superfamily ATPase